MPQPFRGIDFLKTREDATTFQRHLPIGFVRAHQWAASLSSSSSLVSSNLSVKLKMIHASVALDRNA